jgi:hypothetical protein
MRLVPILLPLALIAAPFAACSNNSSLSPVDGGVDGYVAISNDATDEFSADVPFVQEAAPVTMCVLSGDADPVGLCVQQAALKDLHAHAFVATKGVTGSWSSTTALPDPDDAGVVGYSLDETVAYAAAAASYLTSAELYGDTTINGLLREDLMAIALQLETSFAVPSTEYSGELYFHLRTVAAGLRKIELDSDGDKFDKLAEAYGRSIYCAHYTSLGTLASTSSNDAGTGDGGALDAAAEGGKVAEAGVADAGKAVADGIFGNVTGSGQVAYATADVATAAYALLDLVARNPTDTSGGCGDAGAGVSQWLSAARSALNHVQARAHEPTTGMLYTALVANRGPDGGTGDVLAPTTPSMPPSDALLADTQATFALALIRAQYLVTSNTTALLGGADSSGPIVDAGVTGPFVPILDLPLEAWADSVIHAMNGSQSLWDGVSLGSGKGYLDGYVPSTSTFITSKSTRANSFMAAVARRSFINNDPILDNQRPSLVQLLIAQSFSVPLHSNLITVLPMQLAYLRGASQTFDVLDSGPNPSSYTSAAVSSAVEGLNEQLFGAVQ